MLQVSSDRIASDLKDLANLIDVHSVRQKGGDASLGGCHIKQIDEHLVVRQSRLVRIGHDHHRQGFVPAALEFSFRYS